MLTVVTIGVAGLLAGLELALPPAVRHHVAPAGFPSPFDFSFTIAPTVFRGNDIMAMLAVPPLIAALIAFFRYTTIGIAVRASAESADRASLLGVPVKRIQTIVWVVATVFAALAIFLRAGIIGLPFGSRPRPSHPAASVGRRQSSAAWRDCRRSSSASLGVGDHRKAVVWSTGRAVLVDPILFLVIIGALLLQRRGQLARADEMDVHLAGGARP